MNFNLTNQQEMVRKIMREFAVNERSERAHV